MTVFSRAFRRVLSRGQDEDGGETASTTRVRAASGPDVDIAGDDPLLAYFQTASGAIDIDALDLDSPALADLRAAGMKLAVPLVSQGELIGLLSLGPRLSERDYSGDDRKLLDNLAAQAAPAVRVAQLVRQQEAEVRMRERLENELRVAQLIQQQFLPRELPKLRGWHVEAYYRPARAVGGDFYDFIELSDGRVGIVVGDVTDKGVPAALVMATTHSVLRSDPSLLDSPAEVLTHANDRLHPDIPEMMFVTCLYMVLDPRTGHVRFANAGHNLPYVHGDGGLRELRATGTPLGMLPGVTYDEVEATLEPGDTVLFHSDGLAEAHDPDGEMFGFPRLKSLVAEHSESERMIDSLLHDLDAFTGPGWDQEDDITLLTLHRTATEAFGVEAPSVEEPPSEDVHSPEALDRFEVPSEPGREREVMQRVVEAVRGRLPASKLDRLKTAVAETAMNAIEHGNRNDASLPVKVTVTRAPGRVSVFVTDNGGGREIPEVVTPDIEAKLEGRQTPRGWGLFLIKNMVDDMNVTSDDTHHTVELVFRTEEGGGRGT